MYDHAYLHFSWNVMMNQKISSALARYSLINLSSNDISSSIKVSSYKKQKRTCEHGSKKNYKLKKIRGLSKHNHIKP